MRKLKTIIFLTILLLNCVLPKISYAKESEDSIETTGKSVVLMEATTGNVIYEKNKDEPLVMASITKIMTLILIFEALEEGKIKLEDLVSVSEYAASMGGSQVYLEPYETQTVNDMIKCISIASANDACVAMSEYIAGSETEFVSRMNEMAKKLGMEHTHFLNCCGLDNDIDSGHYSSAYDVALMSRELITKYPQISDYSTVWMDSIIHTTKKGESEFGLTNTNKLVRSYEGITGLKTGSTSKAKYCLSATARRNGMDMIAVVMAAESPKDRFHDAAKLLDYGFANCELYKDEPKDNSLEPLLVKGGKTKTVTIQTKEPFSYVLVQNEGKDSIEKQVQYVEDTVAPIKKGDKLGEIQYYLSGKQIGSIDIVSLEDIDKAYYLDYLNGLINRYFVK
ncbi:MAG: D-alanyl-D-alanine carboxypeptidase family protein [Velocimicrobium sp.]